jgi:Zn-dependent metalloprotease
MLSLAPLTALATLLATGAAGAAEWHRVHDVASAPGAAPGPSTSPRAAAEGYLARAAAELRLQGVDLAYRTELQVGAHRTVRFTQRYAGLPVIGGEAAVRLTPEGEVEAVVLEVGRGIAVSPTPGLDEAAARDAVTQAIGLTPAVTPIVHLAVMPEDEGPGRLVWSVDVFPATRRALRYLVDAHAGGIVGVRPLALDALGRVYPVSSVNTPQTEDLPLTDLDVSAPQVLTGWSGNLTVTNYVSGGSMGNLVAEQTLNPNSGEDFLYDPPADPLDGTDPFAQVGIFYHLTRIRDYFRDTHGIDFSPASWKITAIANMQEDGQGFDNAYFSPDGLPDGPYASPNLIAIGQGTEFDFAQDSDVFLHEFGHYVSQNAIGYNGGQLAVSEYGLSPWGGSIDEGIADYFACTLNGDPTLGEASLAFLGATRELTNTAKVCPDDIFGEVHADGEIIGSLSWSVRTAFGQDNGDELVWGALTTLTSGSSFGDFAKGLQLTASDMMAQGKLTAADLQTLDGMLADRGMDDCDHVLEVSSTKTRRITMFGLDLISQVVGATCSSLRAANIGLHSLFHFQSTPAAGDKGIRFSVDMDPSGGSDLEWGIYVRAGQHVGMATGGLLPKPDKFDYSIEKITETHGELVIDASSNPPFDPAQTYYMVIGHANCPLAVATIAASASGDPMGEGGAGGAGGAGAGGDGDTPKPAEDSGCGCRVAGAEAPAASLAALSGLALAAAGALRRRVRRARSH